MSPLSINVSFDKVEALSLAMKIAFTWFNKAKSWAETDDGCLVFYWHAFEGTHALPAALDSEGAFDLAVAWLHERPAASYGREPDHDGDNKKGFCVFNTGPSLNTGKAREQYAIVAIKPVWIEYHK